ncbi:gliding motility-associated C-terminal domain-containing protein [Paraflavitalea speifideaquila]|uniref:gliding motility-associated C-terminal domain-containing protein n=1 Tax=Paraflavitalea speifideaquila TaxID=3076558 RepID=UPI0028E8B380|nr:gliding motility-associated C-terminal domain-containing protein [Paraflavitalea speifideiaquila]
MFSPDNDGVDDFATIQYLLAEPGYVANITLFDAGGIPVRQLARNATLGKEGVFRWDGLDNNRRRLPLGTYIILAEIFNGQGKTKKLKIL